MPLQRLPQLKERVLIASLGGPVGTLATLGEKGPAVAHAYARHLNLREAPIAWHTIRTSIAETGAWLALLIGSLGKMARDIAELSSTDVGEVAEPHMPGRGGSSAMPHKRNPVSATVIIAAQSAAKGHLVTLYDGMMAATGAARWPLARRVARAANACLASLRARLQQAENIGRKT